MSNRIAPINQLLQVCVALFLFWVMAPYGFGAESGTTAQVTKEMFEQWRVKAEQGDAEARFQLGHCYFNGKGVPQDYVQAAIWYRIAAEQGHAGAQRGLGVFYSYVVKSATEAEIWYRKAAEQGDATTQWFLGACYSKGEGVPQDAVQSVFWYRKAAEQGHATAQSILGCCYDSGEGVPQDFVLAYMWLNLSAASIDANTAKSTRYIRDKIAKKLTPEQLAEAQKLSREWKPKKETDKKP